MLLSAKECANFVITVIPIVMTLLPAAIIAQNWIKLLLSVIPAKRKSGCRLDKAYYRATIAHKQYRTVLVESRAGINISPEELIKLDELVSPLILNGQSPYMILQHHPEIPYSEKTIYNYIESGALSVRT